MGTVVYFETEQAAQAAIKKAGFALGINQRDDPRGLMHDCEGVSKWRNLSQADRGQLHGVYQRAWKDGPVEVVLSRNCPTDARIALEELASEEPSTQ